MKSILNVAHVARTSRSHPCLMAYLLSLVVAFLAVAVSANSCQETFKCLREDGTVCETTSGMCPGCLAEDLDPSTGYRLCVYSTSGVCADGYNLCSSSADRPLTPTTTIAPRTTAKTTTTVPTTTKTTSLPTLQPETTVAAPTTTIADTTKAPSTIVTTTSTPTTVVPTSTPTTAVPTTTAASTNSSSDGAGSSSKPSDTSSQSSSATTPVALGVGAVAFVCLALFAFKKFRRRPHDQDEEDIATTLYSNHPTVKTNASTKPPPSSSESFSNLPTQMVLSMPSSETEMTATRNSRQGTRLSVEFEIHAMPSPVQNGNMSFGTHANLWDEVEHIKSERDAKIQP
ncbi:hypothetical protein LEN26_016047 [Aphanomyces euteiches]|nr:hypothetical protein LEN26_016047 [Aphanomyces euteiches]KAH9125008.1 hypothetical protein AeMF1_004312 [Aphanomyces euteiches]KAH9186562.1 hypothetical protein AeNC1_011457 [Aphanomyces euteiches]